MREVRYVQAICVGSLSISAGLCFVLLARSPTALRATAFFVLADLTVASWFLIERLARKEKRIIWFLSVAVLNLAVIAPEVALRIVDFRYESGIQFAASPRPTKFAHLDPDSKLFWKFPRSQPGINSWGFPGKEVVVPKPAGSYRILFLGDSTAQQGYPELVELFLNARRHDSVKRVDSVALAIAGYSSHQGRVIAEMYGEVVDPDLVFVYYGWNDHWLAWGRVDAEKVVTTAPPPGALYRGSRLAQAVNWFIGNVRRTQSHQLLKEVRVPPKQYRENLLRISGIFAAKNVPVIFSTAPTSHYRLGVPDLFLQHQYIADKGAITRMHREYNQIVREAARTSGLYLLDLEERIDVTDDLRTVFLEDGIHFTPTGLALIAQEIANFIETEVLAGRSGSPVRR